MKSNFAECSIINSQSDLQMLDGLFLKVALLVRIGFEYIFKLGNNYVMLMTIEKSNIN